MILVGGYDLTGGDNNWTSLKLDQYSFFYLDLFWRNGTGTPVITIRQSDTDVWETIQTITLDEEFTKVNSINLKKRYMNIQFTGTATGKLSAELTPKQSALQIAEENAKRYTLLNA